VFAFLAVNSAIGSLSESASPVVLIITIQVFTRSTYVETEKLALTWCEVDSTKQNGFLPRRSVMEDTKMGYISFATKGWKSCLQRNSLLCVFAAADRIALL